MKNFVKNRKHTIAFYAAIVAAVVVFGGYHANAQVNNITDFTFNKEVYTNLYDPDRVHKDDNWWIVDNTKKLITRDGTTICVGSFLAHNEPVIPYLGNPVLNGNGNCFQLTDTFNYQSVAMWNKQPINLNQCFELRFKMFFGSGKTLESIAADGIAFVLHTLDTNVLPTTIGGTETKLGYAAYNPSSSELNIGGCDTIWPTGVNYSFGIEFDIEWNQAGGTAGPTEILGVDGQHTRPQIPHIAFLRNGNWRANESEMVGIQNNGGNVTNNKWYCGRIKWVVIKNNAGVITGYNLSVYLQENGAGPLVKRIEKTFSSLSQVISVPINANGEANVHWGITASTCNTPNLQQIEFLSLTMGESLPIE